MSIHLSYNLFFEDQKVLRQLCASFKTGVVKLCSFFFWLWKMSVYGSIRAFGVRLVL